MIDRRSPLPNYAANSIRSSLQSATSISYPVGSRTYQETECGHITLSVLGERFDLGTGDVAAFPGDRAHSYENAGTGVAVGFSVVTLAPI